MTAWRLAGTPTRRSPLRVKATTDGSSRGPSEVGITVGSPPSITATTELVVPKSIPTILAIACLLDQSINLYRSPIVGGARQRSISGLLEQSLRKKGGVGAKDRKSTRLNSSHSQISYAVFCLK